MPKDWPKLIESKSLEILNGFYSVESFYLLAIWLFDKETTQDIRLKTEFVKIKNIGNTHIEVIAIDESKKNIISKRTIEVKLEKGKISFISTTTAKDWLLYEGGGKTVTTLYKNINGELVFQREFTLYGKRTKDGKYFEDVSMSWEKAESVNPEEFKYNLRKF
jgi:hypothetical protein